MFTARCLVAGFLALNTFAAAFLFVLVPSSLTGAGMAIASIALGHCLVHLLDSGN